MASGNPFQAGVVRTSPILIALAEAESGSTGEIRVHLSRRWIERDPFARAAALFREFGMARTAKRNAVLVYVNLRRHKFAIAADEGINSAVGQRFWEKLSRELAVDLRSTHPEKAVAMTVTRIGEALKKHFPAEA
jgi:uncharacterized membrane protein